MRIALVLAACSLVSALLCALGFMLLVGMAFGRRDKPGAKLFSQMILGLGIKVGGGNPALAFFVSWATWTLVFAGAAWTMGLM